MIYLVSKTTKEHFDAATFSPEDANDRDLMFVRADDNGWVQHVGNECPVPKNSRVQVRYALGNGPSRPITRPQNYSWRQDGHLNGRIVAYRPILEDEPKGGVSRTPIMDSVRDGAVKGQVTVSADEPEWPPVGERVRIITKEGDQGCADVVAHHNGGCVVWQHSDMEYRRWHREFIRPIRSEEDLAVDDMKAVAGVSYVKPEHMEMITRALYRAGYRKVERRRDEKG